MDKGVRSIAELFTRHGRDLVRWARRALRSETDAEDVVQEVMVALLRDPHALVGVDRLGGWLFTLVRRRSVDHIRRQARRRDKEAEWGLEDLLSGVPLPDQEEILETTVRVVRSLPEPLRFAFVQNGLEGRTFREISERTGIPMGTLMSRKKRAVERIRAELIELGFLE